MSRNLCEFRSSKKGTFNALMDNVGEDGVVPTCTMLSACTVDVVAARRSAADTADILPCVTISSVDGTVKSAECCSLHRSKLLHAAMS